MSITKFPYRGEPWIECAICGFDIPRSEAVVHYKKKFLVDRKCADALAHDDYMELVRKGREREDPSEQRVSAQGEADFLSDAGAGSGGAGAGSAGERTRI